MSEKANPIRVLAVLVGLCLLCGCGFCSWPFIYAAQLEGTVDDFDALNANVFSELPSPPPNTSVEHVRSDGNVTNSFVYGRTLVVEYQTESDMDDLVRHYEPLLLADGWTLEYTGMRTRRYMRDEACLRFDFFLESLGEYWVRIWYDFERHSFSPWTPPRFLLALYDGGKSIFRECR